MNDLETADINSKWRRLKRKRSFVNLNSIKIGIQTRWPNTTGTFNPDYKGGGAGGGLPFSIFSMFSSPELMTSIFSNMYSFWRFSSAAEL